MTIVKRTSSLLMVVFCLIVTISCIRSTKNKEENKNSIVIDTIIYDYSNIETKRGKDEFDLKLINTLPVKVGDTVLFCKDTFKYPIRAITLINKTSKFEIKPLDVLNYYKTGTNKFSTYGINIKNLNNNNSFNFYSYGNYGNKGGNPYSPSNMSSLVNIKKINDTLAKIDVNNNNLHDYDIYFKINNDNTLCINKIFLKYNLRIDEQQYYYQLDTLININKKNKYIDLYKLQDVTEVEKNIRYGEFMP